MTARCWTPWPSAPCTSFIEELGLECAVWPNLYWKTSMCETHERYTDKRRLEREHDEVDLEDVEGADGQRHSVKRSFRAKLLGPLLGYSADFALLQFVYDLQMWSELGAKRNIAESQGNKMRLMMAQHPMSPLYWRGVLAGLQDLVRQIGPPQLYWTFAPWEMSFPYSEFLLDELRKQLRGRYGAPAHETLHIATCMLEAVRGFMAGGAGAPGDKTKWSRFLLQGKDVEGKPAGCFHFFTRLEFQDGAPSATMAAVGLTCTSSSGWTAQSTSIGRSRPWRSSPTQTTFLVLKRHRTPSQNKLFAGSPSTLQQSAPQPTHQQAGPGRQFAACPPPPSSRPGRCPCTPRSGLG